MLDFQVQYPFLEVIRNYMEYRLRYVREILNQLIVRKIIKEKEKKRISSVTVNFINVRKKKCMKLNSLDNEDGFRVCRCFTTSNINTNI